MERRTFLTSTLGTSVLAAAGPWSAERSQEARETPPARQFFVWRQYVLRIGTQPRRLADFLQNAAVPALNRLGHRPVGVFEAVVGTAAPGVFVLTPFDSLDAFASVPERLEQDQEFLRAADAYLKAPATDPVFVRQEVSILHAFPNVPRIEPPPAAAGRGSRLFELRVYESHSETAHRAKMSMFTTMGELEIFRRCGLTPVFFGRTIAGARIPSFIYLLVHEGMAAREKSWDAFRSDPEWKKLAATPGYADAEILSNITTWFLRPVAYSQI